MDLMRQRMKAITKVTNSQKSKVIAILILKATNFLKYLGLNFLKLKEKMKAIMKD